MTPGAGRYVLGDLLGSGGMSLVHRARDQRLERVVAVKLLADNLAADRRARARFLREARAAARLSHPNIVQVLDVGEDAGRPWLVMEYVDGSSLDVVLRRTGPLDPETVAGIAADVAGALECAHEAGVVHRDVKPSNLLRDNGGTVKIGDFGVAEAADLPALTRTGEVLGTTGYLAPERAAGQPATPAADLYGLGATLYELLTGAPPAAPSPDTPVPAVTGAAGDVPGPLAEVVARCLAHDPRDRPRSAAAVVERLAAGLRAPPSTVPRPGPHDRADAGAGADHPGAEPTRPLTVAPPTETVGARGGVDGTVSGEGPRGGDGSTAGGPVGRSRVPAWIVAGLVLAAMVTVVALTRSDSGTGGSAPAGDGAGGAPASAEPGGAGDGTVIPRSDDPAEQARLLAEWLRERAEN